MLLFAEIVEGFNKDYMQLIVSQATHLVLVLSAPMLLAAIISGVAIAVFQAVTQVQEQTLSFVPKIVMTFLAVVTYGPWIASEIVAFTLKILNNIGNIGPKYL
jgi:flagellar biosynthetic protein FliQ